MLYHGIGMSVHGTERGRHRGSRRPGKEEAAELLRHHAATVRRKLRAGGYRGVKLSHGPKAPWRVPVTSSTDSPLLRTRWDAVLAAAREFDEQGRLTL
jgi:hypothetical protein